MRREKERRVDENGPTCEVANSRKGKRRRESPRSTRENIRDTHFGILNRKPLPCFGPVVVYYHRSAWFCQVDSWQRRFCSVSQSSELGVLSVEIRDRRSSYTLRRRDTMRFLVALVVLLTCSIAFAGEACSSGPSCSASGGCSGASVQASVSSSSDEGGNVGFRGRMRARRIARLERRLAWLNGD